MYLLLHKEQQTYRFYPSWNTDTWGEAWSIHSVSVRFYQPFLSWNRSPLRTIRACWQMQKRRPFLHNGAIGEPSLSASWSVFFIFFRRTTFVWRFVHAADICPTRICMDHIVFLRLLLFAHTQKCGAGGIKQSGVTLPVVIDNEHIQSTGIHHYHVLLAKRSAKNQ